MKRKISRTLVTPFWIALYVPVILHELGHYAVGLLLGFPVAGIEIGPFPHRIFKVKKFTLALGSFPRNGKTLLTFTSRTFPKWAHALFLSGGILLELALALFVLWIFRAHRWICLLIAVVLVEQLWANLIPKYEDGKAASDGAFLFEFFFPKQARSLSLRSKDPLSSRAKDPLSFRAKRGI